MKAETKTKIKDWFIITGIRISNFIKEHKYVSAIVGVFLLTTFISLIAKAIDSVKTIADAGNVEIQNITITTEGTDKKTAPNFSTVIYTLKYHVGSTTNCDKNVDEVTFEIKLKSANNVSWDILLDDDFYTVDNNKESEDYLRKLTVKEYNIPMCSNHSQNFSLSVQNAEQNNEIAIESVKIKAGSSDSATSSDVSDETFFESAKVYSNYSEEIDASSIILENGVAPKSNDGRNTYFGILLGFESPNSNFDLKGKYIKNINELYLAASETIDGNTIGIDLSSSNSGYGIYTDDVSKNNYFTSLPILSNSNDNDIKKFEIATINSSDVDEAEEISTPEVTLKDSQKITLENHTLNDLEIQSLSSAKKLIASGNKKITPKYTNSKLSSIEYEVTSENTSTTLIQNIEFVEKAGSVALRGPVTQYINSLEDFNEYGVESGQPTIKFSKDNQNTISENDVDELSNIATKEGAYYEKYVDKDGNVIAIRKIALGEKTFSNKTSKVTKNSVVIKGATFNDTLKFDSQDFKCTEENGCTVSPDINTDETGNKEITYTIKKDNYILTLQKTIIVKEQYYKMLLKNKSNDIDFEVVKNGDKYFYIVGSYYAIVPSSLASTVTLNIYDSKGNLKGTKQKTNVENSIGTNTISNDLYVEEQGEYVKVDSDKKEGLSGDYYTASMGEEVEVRSKFSYGIDADSKLSKVQMLIDVDENLTPTSYFKNIDEVSENPSLLYYEINISKPNSYSYSNTTEDFSNYFKTNILYCTSNSKCNIKPVEYDSKTKITNIMITIEPTDNLEDGMIGANFSVKTHYIVSTITDNSNISDIKISSALKTTIYSSGNNLKDYEALSETVYLTPYKIRSSIAIGKNDEFEATDITLDVSKNDIYTAQVSTSMISPAMRLYSNILGYSEITVPVKITLPVGVNYIHNENYQLKPDKIDKSSSGETIIVYRYSSVKPNIWQDDIYFDFNINVDVPNGRDLIITTKVGNHESTKINNDLSSSDKFKTVQNIVHVQNTKLVSYGQYAYDTDGIFITSINKEDSFKFETKLYNNSENNVSNIEVSTILPSNTSRSSFHGTYTISSFPSNAQCTNVPYEELVTNISNVQWTSCDNFKTENSYNGVTAYKVTYPSLASATTQNTQINMNLFSNLPDDVYEFMSKTSYTLNGQSYSEDFEPLRIGVVSKKITGVVWEDFDENGIMNDDELKIDKVTLTLHNVDTGEEMQTVPNKNGVYTFSGFEAGNYYIIAEFNKDKYASTVALTEDVDPSKVSVFESEEIDKAEDEENEVNVIVKTDTFKVDKITRYINNMNLGLVLRRNYKVKLNKYITRVEITNQLGVVTKKEYGNVKLAKLDVKDIANVKIKVVYTIEVQNVKYYPVYVTMISDKVPDGMVFNSDYKENEGWVLNEDGSLANFSLQDELIEENEKKYLTVSFDVVRKEAGSFINFASVEELSILGGREDE